MTPHPSQPGLEVNDSPGLEVVYMSNNDGKDMMDDRAPVGGGYTQAPAPVYNGYRQTNFHPSPHSQVSPVEYRQTNYYDGSDKEVAAYGPPKERKMILGLPVLVFWTIIILISAGAIAGGVGGSLAVKNAEINAQRAAAAATANSTTTSSSSSFLSRPTQTLPVPSISFPPTSTSSLTASTAKPSSNLDVPSDGGCPAVNNTRFTPRTSSGSAIGVPDVVASQSFLRLCNTNYPAGEAYGNPGVADIYKTYAATLDDCMALCAAYNAEFNKPGSTQFNPEKGFCKAVTIIKKAGEFCYLKNGTGGNNTMGAPNDVTSAVLVEELVVP